MRKIPNKNEPHPAEWMNISELKTNRWQNNACVQKQNTMDIILKMITIDTEWNGVLLLLLEYYVS